MIRTETHLKQKIRCPDCFQCQSCGETRCRVCRRGQHYGSVSELGCGFTHGEYLAWKKGRYAEKPG